MASKIFLNTGKFPATYDRIVKKISESGFSGDYNYKKYDLYDAVNQGVLLFKVFNPDETRGTNATWCFEPERTQTYFVATNFVSNNKLDNNQTEAITRLTAQQDFNYLSFDYSYYGDSNTTSEDIFTIKIQKDETAIPLEITLKLERNTLNSGTYTIGNRTDPILIKEKGFIEFKYKKSNHNASAPDKSDWCSFSNIYGEWQEDTPTSKVKSVKNMYVGVDGVNKAVKRAYVGVYDAETKKTTPKLFFTQLPLMMSSSASIGGSNKIGEIDSLSKARYDLCATTSSHTDTNGNLVHQAWFGGGMTSLTAASNKVQRYDEKLTRQDELKFYCTAGDDGGGGYCTAVSTGNRVIFFGGTNKSHVVHPFAADTGVSTHISKFGDGTSYTTETKNPNVKTRGGAVALKNGRVFFGGGNLGKSVYQLGTDDYIAMIYYDNNEISRGLIGETTAATIAGECAIFLASNGNMIVKGSDGTTIDLNKPDTANKSYEGLISISGETFALFICSDKNNNLKCEGLIFNGDLTELTGSWISTRNTPRAYGAGTRLGNHILIAGGISGYEAESDKLKKEMLYQSIDVYDGETFALETSETNSILSEPRAHLAATTLTVKDYENGNDKFSGDCAIFAGGYSSKTINISDDTVNSVTASDVVDVFTIKSINTYN